MLPPAASKPQVSASGQSPSIVRVGDVVTSRLSNGRAGITKVLQMDISCGMLQRDQATAQVLVFYFPLDLHCLAGTTTSNLLV